MKNKLLDIDAVFDGFEIDERKVNASTGALLRPKVTKETRKILSDAHIGNTHTDETKQKMSNTRKGRVGKTPSRETKKKLSDANRGYEHTTEAKKKIKERSSNSKWVTNDVINKRLRIDDPIPKGFRLGRTGRIFTEEHKLKLSLAAKQRKSKNEK
jgi:hypothetical protein